MCISSLTKIIITEITPWTFQETLKSLPEDIVELHVKKWTYHRSKTEEIINQLKIFTKLKLITIDKCYIQGLVQVPDYGNLQETLNESLCK